LDAINDFTLQGSKKDADAAQILVCLYHAVIVVRS
jgi:hypothetical protein